MVGFASLNEQMIGTHNWEHMDGQLWHRRANQVLGFYNIAMNKENVHLFERSNIFI